MEPAKEDSRCSKPQAALDNPGVSPRDAPNLIRSLHQADVLSGRGGLIQSYSGNRFFQDLVQAQATGYAVLSTRDKTKIAKQIMKQIHQRGGRFVRKVHFPNQDDNETGSVAYVEIDMSEALAKTSQALRSATHLRRRRERAKAKKSGRESGDIKHAPSPLPATSKCASVTQPSLPATNKCLAPTPSPQYPSRGPIVPILLGDPPAVTFLLNRARIYHQLADRDEQMAMALRASLLGDVLPSSRSIP